MSPTDRRWRTGNLVLLAILTAAIAAAGPACEGGKASAPAASPQAQARPAAQAAPATQPAVKPIKAPIDRFEKAIAAYEAKDRAKAPPQGATLFVGSSSFALWRELEKDFADLPAINRGFGGSTLPEVIHYARRIILPYRPSRIVVYCGENDIAAGASPEMVLENFAHLVELVRKELPGVKVCYLTMKLSQSRLKHREAFERANGLIRELADRADDVGYIDIYTVLLKDGQPIEEAYLKDKLHMNRSGYERIIPVIRDALKKGT